MHAVSQSSSLAMQATVIEIQKVLDGGHKEKVYSYTLKMVRDNKENANSHLIMTVTAGF